VGEGGENLVIGWSKKPKKLQESLKGGEGREDGKVSVAIEQGEAGIYLLDTSSEQNSCLRKLKKEKRKGSNRMSLFANMEC